MQAIDFVTRDGSGRLSGGSFEAQISQMVLDVGGSNDISLNLLRDNVHSYRRNSSDLKIILDDGREIILENFFSEVSADNPNLYFSANGEIYEINFSESWGRTNFARFTDLSASGEANGLVFEGGGAVDAGGFVVSDAAATVTTVAPEATMAVAPLFLGGGGVAAGAAAIGGGALLVGAGGGGGGGSAPPHGIATIGQGGDNILNSLDVSGVLTITGLTYPNTEVVVTLGNASMTVLSDANGDFTASFPAGTLPDGEYTTTVTASVTNPDGQAENFSESLQIDTFTLVDIEAATVEIDGVINAAEASDGVTLTGTTQPGSAVIVEFMGTTLDATVDGSGNWTVTYPAGLFGDVDFSNEVVTATATDGAGNTATQSETITVDTAVSVQIDTPIMGDNVINIAEAGAGPIVTGTADAGASVDVTFNGTTETVIATNNGTWSVTFDPATVPDHNVSVQISAVATDAAGNTASAQAPVYVDHLGTVAIDGAPLEIDDIVNAGEQVDGIVITGTTLADSTVVVDFHGTSHNATVAADGSWSVTVPAGDIPLGTYTASIVATATTPTGNVSNATDTVQIDTEVSNYGLTGNAVSDDNIINSQERDEGVAITGTVEPGTVVSVELHGVVRNAAVDANGNWTVTFTSSDIPEGDYQTQMTATAVDPAGNTSTITQTVNVDTIPGTLVISAEPLEGDGIINADEASDGFDLGGQADPGATVEITLGGVTHTVVAGPDGEWTVHFAPDDIPPGSYDVPLVIQTYDPSGNVTTVTQDVEIDTEVSNITFPAGDPIGGDDGIISAQELEDGVELVGTAEPGSTVLVAVGNQQFPATVALDGSWTLTLGTDDVPTGSYPLDITVTIGDAAGNIAVVSQTVAVDTEIENFGVTGSSMDGFDVLNAFQAQQGVTMSGTVEPGATVSVTFHNTVKDAVVDANGNWTITFAGDEVPIGEFVINAQIVATDLAGNSATTTSQFVLDTAVPAAPEITVLLDEGSDGLRGVYMPAEDATYSVHQMDDAGNVGSVSYTMLYSPSNDEYILEFDNNVAQGNDLILGLDDDAGNASAALFVLDSDGDPVVDMGIAGLDDFEIEAVDLTFAADVQLNITAEQLEGLSELSDSLLVRGGDDDQVIATGAVNTGETEIIEGETYDIYTLGDNGAHMLIDQDIDVVI